MKLKVKETSYSAKPKQDEGKLVVRYDSFTIKPKQSEGKLLILNRAFTVKPKPDGIRIYATNTRSVVKTDARNGLKIYRNSHSSVLKHDRRSGVRLYRTNNIRVLKQTCDGTIFTWDAIPSFFRFPAYSNNTLSTSSGSAAITISTGLLTRIYGTERPIVVGVTWSNTMSGGNGGVNFPDGTYPETASSIFYLAEIRKTPTAVDNSAGSVVQGIIGLTGMSGSPGVSFSIDSAAGNYWFIFRAGTTGTTPLPTIPSGTKIIREFTLSNLSDGNSHLGKFLLGWRYT
jgi:hypothetical protein